VRMWAMVLQPAVTGTDGGGGLRGQSWWWRRHAVAEADGGGGAHACGWGLHPC
jgi:hypothetical protein